MNGLWLFPHFSKRTTAGWFDKFLPWRADTEALSTNIIMICPSDEFLATLPHGKIPDRQDFGRMSEIERIQYWKICVQESERLGDEFCSWIGSDDPLATATLV